MKQIKWLLALGLVITMLPHSIFNLKVSANTKCQADDYVLANINDDQSQTVLGCFGTFVEANNALKNNSFNHANLIVTHRASRSPLKIIAASRAVAYSYTQRWGSGTSNLSTMDIWRNSNRTGDTTYIPAHYDMAYYETTSYDPSDGSGTIKIQTSGFIGYTRLIQVDLVPYIYIEKDWPIQLGGQTYNEYYNKSKNESQPHQIVPNVSEFRVQTNTTYHVRELRHYIFRSHNGKFSSYTYGMAPDWLKNGTYYSWDMITYYYDKQMTNPVLDENNEVGRYFNYYQYLPWRTSSSYDGQALDAYLEQAAGYKSKSASVMYREGNAFFNAQNTYGVNGLLTYALAIHESGHGTSSIAKNKNNLFGWGAHDANPSDAYLFESVSQSVSEHMGRNLRGYLSTENWRYFGQVLGNKDNGFNTKYASDPYWGSKAAGHAYKIDRFHGFKDYGQYQLVVVNRNSPISIKKTATTDTAELTKLRTTLNDQVMIMSNIKKEGNNTFIEVMSPMPVENTQVIAYKTTSNQLVPYNWHNSVGYLMNESVKIIYENKNFMHQPNVANMQIVAKPSITKAEKLEFENGKIEIEGYHYQDGISVLAVNQLMHGIHLVKDKDTKLTFNLSTVSNNNAQALTQDLRYKTNFMGFKGSMDLKDVDIGLYALHIESVANVGLYPIKYESPLRKDGLNLNFKLNNKTFTLLSNDDHHVYLNVSASQQETITPKPFVVLNQLTKTHQLEVSGEAYSFASSDETIISVTNTGLVTALQSGSADIVIKKDEEEQARVKFVVYVKADTFEINKANVNINAHDQVEIITTQFIPATSTSKDVSFVSLNNYVVSINDEGLMTPRNNGKTQILVLSKANPALYKVVEIRVDFDKPVTDPPDPETNGLLGDVNEDGDLNVLDMIKISRYIVGLENFSERQKRLADVNGDSEINVLDMIKLSRKIVGLE
ncbi:MAG: hypothetical protein GX845_05585 [Erysipelothrix sp.]|jgi:beta-N-acetylglucosaminidase|nr:hypothetical protein [Erysipelothrix sp.]